MSDRKKVLALCAHPDDAEIRCGGTLILLAKAGWEVHVATLSPGDMGSAELQPNVIARTRYAEAQAAAKRMGGTYQCVGGTDLQLFDSNDLRGAVVAVLREVEPDVVITHYPIDYMPDHEVASALARGACFCAPIINYIVGRSAPLAPTKGIPALYYFGPLGGVDYFGNPVPMAFHVDVSSVINDKSEALGCHASQRDWLRRQHGIDQYIEEMKHWDAETGAPVGLKYAEAFIMHKGHAFPQTPVIEEALAECVKR